MTRFGYKIKSKKKFVFTIIVYVATLFTLWKDVCSFINSTQYIFSGISTFLLLVIIIINCIEIFSVKIFTLSDEESIARYLSKLYQTSGEFIIFVTGSMKWVIHHGIKQKLLAKAEQHNLTIFIPKQNAYTDDFKKAGAKIIDYNQSGFRPSTNFSIIRPGEPDAMIAIGRAFNSDEHIIEEYKGNDTIMFLTNDIQKLLKLVSNADEAKN